jgi:RNase H-fold protein (predicted Holliday junction resolvase)
MFDIIVVDWGSVRFGMAFGSSSMNMVVPCQYDCYNASIWETIQKEIQARKTIKILVGMPLTRQLQLTEVSSKVIKFVEDLKILYPKIEILTINERNTTKMALLGTKLFDRKTQTLTKHGINHNSAVEIGRLYLSSNI